MMRKYEKLGTKLVFESTLLHIYEDHLRLPDGHEVYYDLLRHRGGAAVLPILPDGKLLLIRQYRNAVDDFVYEIPAGLMEETDPDGTVCAKRELEEETGYVAGTLKFVSEAYGCIGFADEKTFIYIGENLTKGTRHLDPDEQIELCEFELAQALSMIQSREIVDGKTVLAIYAYQAMKREDHGTGNTGIY